MEIVCGRFFDRLLQISLPNLDEPATGSVSVKSSHIKRYIMTGSEAELMQHPSVELNFSVALKVNESTFICSVW
ncbi:MAG TPA: hypothetical protein DEF45_12675 [Rhodopirellula sp.]|nr:hypothetical protein [Rhodopirellula sp.]